MKKIVSLPRATTLLLLSCSLYLSGPASADANENPKEAIKSYRKAITLDPEDVSSHILAFTLQVGGLSEIIEAPTAYFLLKVESREPGNADDFDNPKVRQVSTALFVEQRRQQWEKDYLEHLQQRIEEDQAGQSGG